MYKTKSTSIVTFNRMTRPNHDRLMMDRLLDAASAEDICRDRYSQHHRLIRHRGIRGRAERADDSIAIEPDISTGISGTC